jgi:hypothetical protein
MRSKISQKGIDLNTACLVCCRYDEDGAHCFLKCKEVRRIWGVVGLEQHRMKLASLESSEEFVTEVLKLRNDICVTICVLIWRLWEVRNKVNAGELMPTCQATVQYVMNTTHAILQEEHS